MEKKYFIQFILRLNDLGYDEEKKVEVLKTLGKELNEVSKSKKKLILYVFLNFHDFDKRNTLISAIKDFTEERLSILEKIIAMERTDYYSYNEIDSCKQIIEIAKNIDESKLYDLTNILNIAQRICHKRIDKFKFALVLINNFDISMFYDSLSLEKRIYTIDEMMEFDNGSSCSQYDINYPYLTIPEEVNLNELNPIVLANHQLTLKIAKKPDDDDSYSNAD